MGGAGAAGVRRDLHLSRRHRPPAVHSEPPAAAGRGEAGAAGRPEAGCAPRLVGPPHLAAHWGGGGEEEAGIPSPFSAQEEQAGGREPRAPGAVHPLRWLGTLGGRSYCKSLGRFRPKLGLSRRCSAGNADQLKHSEQLSRIRTSGLELSTS